MALSVAQWGNAPSGDGGRGRAEREAQRERWLVAFCDPEPLPPGAAWRDRLLYLAFGLLAPGFRHVFALKPATAFEGWILINPQAAALDLIELPGDDYLALLFEAAARGRARLLWMPGRRPARFQPRGIFTCVAVISHCIGTRSCGIFTTPRALYRALKLDPEVIPMGGFFPKPDTSAADAARRRAEQERDEAKRRNEARLRNRRARQTGRALLAFADESGVAGGKTLLGQ